MAVKSVTAGQSLSAAVSAAQPGDIISVEAGASFVETLIISNKNSDTPITIQSSKASELPLDRRVTAEDAAKMPRIVTPKISDTFSERALKTAQASHHWKLIGLEFAQEPSRDIRTIIDIGDSGQTNPDAIPHSITLDRCFIHGAPDKESQRGIGLNAKLVDILNCRISEIHGIGYDTQAICGWNGIGQYRIINNFLEASGENVMFGGADPAIKNLVAVDVEISRNTFYKPFTWKVGDPLYKGKHWTVKNLFELKALKKVKIDGNIFDGNWVDAQTGWAILFKVQNQDGGCPLCVTEDIEFTNNIIRNSTNGLNVAAYDPYKGSLQLKNVRVANNLWLVDEAWYQGTGAGKLPDGSPATNGADGLILEHNTHLQKTGNTMTLYGGPTARFVYRNNLGARTGYGIKGDGTGEGKIAFDQFCPDGIIEGNVLVGADANIYPANNFYPKTWDEVKLGPDYKLLSTSQYINKGVGGKTPGADMDAIDVAMRAPVLPTPAPTPTPVPQPANQPSPDGTKGVTITDAQGGVWTIGTTKNETLRNKIWMGGGQAKEYKYFNKEVYAVGFRDGKWYLWANDWLLFGDGTKEPGVVIPTPVPQPIPQPVPPPLHPEIESMYWDWSSDPVARQTFREGKEREGWFTVPSGARLWGWRRKV